MKVLRSVRARAAGLPVGWPAWTARVLVVVGPAVTMCSAFAGDAAWSPWLLVLVVLGATECALHADSHVGLGVIVVLVWHWAATVDDVRTPWVVPAALGIAVFHTAMAAAATTPPSASWPPQMWIRWVRRFGSVSIAIVVAWLASLVVASADIAGNALLTFVALAIVTATALVLRARSLSGS
jgi:hypothetical protein